MDLLTYHRTHILTSDMWVPATELQQGQTFSEGVLLREAWYDSDDAEDECVFGLDGDDFCSGYQVG